MGHRQFFRREYPTVVRLVSCSTDKVVRCSERCMRARIRAFFLLFSARRTMRDDSLIIYCILFRSAHVRLTEHRYESAYRFVHVSWGTVESKGIRTARQVTQDAAANCCFRIRTRILHLLCRITYRTSSIVSINMVAYQD